MFVIGVGHVSSLRDSKLRLRFPALKRWANRYRAYGALLYENELPQPQLFVAFGLWKTKPVFISVSS